jgi:signal transduction histidine kinase
VITALRSKEAFARDGLARRDAPFLAILLVGFVLFAVGSPRHWSYFGAAAAAAAGASALAWAVPWQRLPGIAAVVPQLLTVGAIALLRHGQGGSLSGYGALFFVPTLWVACYGTRAALALVLASVALAFWVPIALIGGKLYPQSQWRAGGLLVLTVGLFGVVIQRLIANLVDEQRRRAAAEQRLRETGAYEIHDDVVQDLTVAQLALALDDPPRAAVAIDHALEVSQQIVNDLLRARPHGTPGSLVRREGFGAPQPPP